MLTRRVALLGLCAPAIVRVASLMPVSVMPVPYLTLEELVRRVLDPAMDQLAQQIEHEVLYGTFADRRGLHTWGVLP